MAKQPKYQYAWLISLVFHLVVLSVLVLSFEFSGKMPVLENSDKKGEIVNAVVIDSKIEMPKPMVVKQKKIDAPEKLIPPKLAKAVPEKPTPVEKKQPEPLPEKEAIAIPDPKKKQLQQELIEKQLLADLKKQTDKHKKLKQKSLESEFEKEMKAMAAKSLEQQLLKESDQIASSRAQKMQGVVDKYQALILQAISQNWIIPNNVNRKLVSELMIRLAPGGMVLDVQVVKSSGDLSLDRSAQAAVFKASPLPVPTKSDEFDSFRQFILKVKPENISPV